MQATPEQLSWADANQVHLAAELTRLKGLLGAEPSPAVTVAPPDPPAAIDQLAAIFNLSAFERDVLLLCAGVELDASLATLCAEAHGDRQRSYATFGLAMAILPHAHWSALTPSGALRSARLLDVEPSRGLTAAPLRVDERILHYLAGINLLDPRLQTLLQPSSAPAWIAAGHAAVAAEAGEVLQARGQQPPVLHFCGDDPDGQEETGALVAQAFGRQLFTVPVEDLPSIGPDLEQLQLLWRREALLAPGALLMQGGAAGFSPAARHLAERLPGLVMLASREPVRLRRATVRFEIDKPRPAEQKKIWERELGAAGAALNGTLDAIAEQFRLSAYTIHTTSKLVCEEDGPADPALLWNACRAHARPRLEDLAQRVVPAARWQDLVLPEMQERTLRLLASQVRHRLKVFETWGFSAQGRKGLGVSALFAGESGTGKSLAAEVLAHELGLDLYRIDLSAVVSKYIGETEKNLRRVFDAAEEGGVLLLFDEADALFGKRADVKDSHDRYANIEVSYLLQRMEAYQGLAILTTNLRSTLDRAFQRRLRFIVNFPFPDAVQREAIWNQAFPAGTPTHGLDAKKLARLNVTGGNIRNIALNAAFLAAESRGCVDMEHLLHAAQLEAQKLERSLSEAETRSWV